MSYLDSAEVGIPCDVCGTYTQKTVGWISKNYQFVCQCGAVVRIGLEADVFRKWAANWSPEEPESSEPKDEQSRDKH